MRRLLLICTTFLFVQSAHAQQASVSTLATLSGYTTDRDGAAIPGASVSVEGASPTDHFTATSDDTGYFVITGVHPGRSYRVSAKASSFTESKVENVILTQGQALEMDPIILTARADIEVTAITADEAAQIEVKQEESQRVLGLFPNFYVVYGNGPFTPLPAKLKFHLAFKAMTDPVTFGSVAFLSGIDQAADTPSYVQGAKGFGQRMGANYADTAGNILIGGALLPVLFHQDPRYFVQGTGTKKSRAIHAMEAPFVAKGDNGHSQFNISSIGGDLISGSLQNVYYPPADRGVGLTMSSVGLATAGRVVNALFQEFVFKRLTTHSDAH